MSLAGTSGDDLRPQGVRPAARPDLLRAGAPWITNVALGFLGVLLLGLSRHLAIEFDHFVIGYSETSSAALAVALGGALLVWRLPVDRWTIWIVLLTALLCRLALLTPEPYLSSDVYRYVWDGMVQHHGVNPYRYFPGNEHLRALRDDDIFPNINRRDYAPTIYPPGAQIFFFCVTWLSGTLTMMKLALLAAEAVSVFALMRLLSMLGSKREEVILYAWSPLLIWEIGSSGHIDALVIAYMVLAILFRYRNRPGLTGLALGAAVMVKFYPLLLFPALWRRRDWKMPAALAAVVIAGYAAYSGVGGKVFGFAQGYVQEEGMNSGSRYFLLDAVRHVPGLHSLPTSAYFAFCALCFAPLFWWSWRASSQRDDAHRPVFLKLCAAFAFTLMLLFSPHYPWYVAWLIPLVLLVPNFPMLVYTYSVFYWLTTQYAEPGPKMFFANSWTYAATCFAGLLMLLWHRFRHQVIRWTNRTAA